MKLWKLYFVMMLAILMTLGLSACGKSSSGDDDDVVNTCGDAAGEDTLADCVGEEVFKDATATPACKCVCELTAADCSATETLNAAGCTCDAVIPTGECEPGVSPVSTDNIIGDTYALTISADSAQAACGPPTSPLVCTALPMLLSDALAIGFTTTNYDADTHVLSMVGALLDGVCEEGSTVADCSQPEGTTMDLPPVDFSSNPCVSFAQEGLPIDISGISIPVDIELEGKMDEAAGEMTINRFKLIIAGADIEQAAGLDPCGIVPCVDGKVMAEFHGMVAYFIDGLTIVPMP